MHLSNDAIEDYLRNLVDPLQRVSIELHYLACGWCAGKVEETEYLAQTLRAALNEFAHPALAPQSA